MTPYGIYPVNISFESLNILDIWFGQCYNTIKNSGGCNVTFSKRQQDDGYP